MQRLVTIWKACGKWLGTESALGLIAIETRTQRWSRLSGANSVEGLLCISSEKPKQSEMKKIEAIIKPFKLEEVKDALGEIRHRRHDRQRGQGLRPPEGPHRNLSRQRIHRGLPAEDQNSRSSCRTSIWRMRSTAIVQGGQNRQNRRRQGVRFPVEEAVRIRTEEKGAAAV